MKKVIVAAALIATLAMVGQANAVCIELVGFCDQIEVNLGVNIGTGIQLYGDWDFTCAGSPLAQMTGLYAGGHAVVGTWWEASGPFAWQFDFNVGTMNFDMYQILPGGAPVLWLNGPFAFVPGPCPFAAPGMPIVTN